jgi:hypothetical protein
MTNVLLWVVHFYGGVVFKSKQMISLMKGRVVYEILSTRNMLRDFFNFSNGLVYLGLLAINSKEIIPSNLCTPALPLRASLLSRARYQEDILSTLTIIFRVVLNDVTFLGVGLRIL